MNARTITLRSDLVDRLEALVRTQGRTMDEVFGELLEQYTPSPSGHNWALALAEEMENADIDWQDEPSLSAHSREHFEQHAYEKWLSTQRDAGDDG
jgi:hypothetical protein